MNNTTIITQLIKEDCEGKGDSVVFWLDLANAYGSIPHKLVETTKALPQVPGKTKDLILNY